MNSREDSFHLGVKALIRNREGKVLLLEKERRSKQTYWDLPGGRLQRGETALEALQREVEEEVGLKEINGAISLSMHLTNIRIPSRDADVGLIISVYTFDVFFEFTPELSDEHINFGWFDVFEAIGYLESQYPPELINDLEKQIVHRT
jgi:8-oxo-dGTP pyrophosphatase MutT (NUDIX family)